MRYYLGIDTSCYTTSVALLDDCGGLAADERRLLTVKAGKRGLAQSEMVFQHTRNLPELLEEVLGKADRAVQLAAIGVSASPRPLPESYMPAFLVGLGFARALAALNRVPLRRLSHQENHVFAGLWSAGGPKEGEFLAIHVSGGTTELVRVKRSAQGCEIELMGGSADLHAGQFIDRVGVALGLPFPAGPHLEKLAQAGRDRASRIPVAVRELQVSFAGPESQAQRLIAKGEEPAAVAAGVEQCVADSLARLIGRASEETGLRDVLLVGGVTANSFIRHYLDERLREQQRLNLYYPSPRFSPDNAVGAAFFALSHDTPAI